MTNFPREDFPPERLKVLYYRRWSIESSFRKLKYTIGLSNYHSYKPEYVKQEIWNSLIAYNITEMLDEERTKVYDNGREIAFLYSSESNTLSFDIEEGWHDIGVVICDMAGNKNIIQERTNIHVGYFWLWVIIAGITLCAGAVLLAVVSGRQK